MYPNVPEVTIPEEMQNICREFAQIAAKHGLKSFHVKFEPGWEHREIWGGTVQCFWDWGRHGDDSNRLQIHSEFRVNTSVHVDVPKPQK